MSYCPTLDEIALPDGTLPSCTTLGAYPIIYLDAEGNVLCPTCATRARNDETAAPPPTDWCAFFEGPSTFCDECGDELHPAYQEEEE